MKRVVTVLVALVVLAGCGGSGDSAAPAPSATQGSPAAASPSAPAESHASPAPPAGPRLLSKSELKDVLLTLDQMPPGFTADPEPAEGNKYFCDYKPPFEEQRRATGAFSNDADAQYVSAAVRQFKNAEQASASFDALVKVIGRCKSEVVDGSTAKYAKMSAPKLGDGAVGVQISVDGYTLKQNFVLVGPVIISTGGLGLSAAQIADLLELQVDKYQELASTGAARS